MTQTVQQLKAKLEGLSQAFTKAFAMDASTPEGAEAQKKAFTKAIEDTNKQVEAIKKSIEEEADAALKDALAEVFVEFEKQLKKDVKKYEEGRTKRINEEAKHAREGVEKGAKDAGFSFGSALRGMGGWFGGLFGEGDGKGKGGNEDADADDKKKGGFLDRLNVGGLTGGIFGGLAAWFTGSLFGGGGLFSTIISAMLLIPGFIMGRKIGDEHINKWIDRPSEADKRRAIAGNETQQENEVDSPTKTVANTKHKAREKEKRADNRGGAAGKVEEVDLDAYFRGRDGTHSVSANTPDAGLSVQDSKLKVDPALAEAYLSAYFEGRNRISKSVQVGVVNLDQNVGNGYVSPTQRANGVFQRR